MLQWAGHVFLVREDILTFRVPVHAFERTEVQSHDCVKNLTIHIYNSTAPVVVKLFAHSEFCQGALEI